MKRLESKIGILQHKVKNTNQLKIKNQNLRLEKMRLLKAVERRDKKIKELQEQIDKAIKFLNYYIEQITLRDDDKVYELLDILKGSE